MPLTEKELIRNQIDQWLRYGILRPSCTEYASPVVLVKKKDNSMRLCVNFRKVNKKIVNDRCPLSLTDNTLDQLK